MVSPVWIKLAGVYVLQDKVVGRDAQSVILQTSSVQGLDSE